MLYDLSWLDRGNVFPPAEEAERIQRYQENADLFHSNHFSETSSWSRSVFERVNARIQRVIGNWEDIISFPVLLNYHKLLSLKTADLVAGEYPTITCDSDTDTQLLKDRREEVGFDSRLYSTVLDLSRYGDAVWRVYKSEAGYNTFTVWTPGEWIPIVSQDGTNTIVQHVLAWIENVNPGNELQELRLHVQIHGTRKNEIGKYIHQVYQLAPDGQTIGDRVSSTVQQTGLKHCAVIHIRAFELSDSVFGVDDYMALDSLMAEIMARIGQISVILDKHADPAMTGPTSMLTKDPITKEQYLKTGSFYATSPQEVQPKYLTWDGQLEAAFKELNLLIDQLYILSEMGSSLLGASQGSGQAISGTSMRFKMVNPVAKARRIANALTRPVKTLMSMLTTVSDTQISVFWYDGLPDDPRENIENAKLATGQQAVMPMKTAIMEFFARSPQEARKWIEEIQAQEPSEDPNKPGPQDGTGVNPLKSGSETGFQNFDAVTN